MVSYHFNLLINHPWVAAVNIKMPIKEVTIIKIACQKFSTPINNNS